MLDREGLLRLAVAAEEYKYGLVIRLLCVTGARLGEVLALTWDKVDWERIATIEESSAKRSGL